MNDRATTERTEAGGAAPGAASTPDADRLRDRPHEFPLGGAGNGGTARRAGHPSLSDAELRAREANLRAYARLLDSAVRLPGGFRVGLDGLVGLVPVVGDLVGVGLSSYLVVAAARLGIPRSVVARMIANVAIESTVGMIPIVGDAFDFVFKANERNVRLLERELDRRTGGDAGPPTPD